MRNFSILGGQPLCEQNVIDVCNIICDIKNKFPDIKIFVWTCYTLEELQEKNNPYINIILAKIYMLIDGQYKKEERDVTLHLRGSKNQKLLYQGKDF